MAFTARIPADLQAEAEAYASEVGLSLTGLVSVALREYLDLRSGRLSFRPPVPVVSLPPTVQPAGLSPRPPGQSALASDEVDLAVSRDVSRAPCWCGSGKQLRHCHRRPK